MFSFEGLENELTFSFSHDGILYHLIILIVLKTVRSVKHVTFLKKPVFSVSVQEFSLA